MTLDLDHDDDDESFLHYIAYDDINRRVVGVFFDD